MDISKKIASFRIEAQKYTLRVTREDPKYHLDSGKLKEFIKFRETSIKLIESRDFERLRKAAEKCDDFFRKELIYLLLDRGLYEEAASILPEKTENPQLMHLRVYVAYRLGASFEDTVGMIETNITEYPKLVSKDVSRAVEMWALDLQFWGILLALRGEYKAALQKYDESYQTFPLPETLFNKFCCFNRTSDEDNALETIEHLEKAHDLLKHRELIEKMKIDVSCARYKDKPWFSSFLARYSILDNNRLISDRNSGKESKRKTKGH